MRLSGRPLLDNDADQALFVGRAFPLRAVARSLRDGLNCLVSGDPGSGKTSLVRAVMFGSLGEPIHFSYARAGMARSAGDLLTAVLHAVPDAARAAAAPRVPGDVQPIELIDELVRVMAGRRDIEPGPQVIVVDDVPAVPGFETFGALRDELWQVDAQWLVTTSSAQVSGLLRAPADVFFETTVELGPLAATEGGRVAAPSHRRSGRRRTGGADRSGPGRRPGDTASTAGGGPGVGRGAGCRWWAVEYRHWMESQDGGTGAAEQAGADARRGTRRPRLGERLGPAAAGPDGLDPAAGCAGDRRVGEQGAGGDA